MEQRELFGGTLATVTAIGNGYLVHVKEGEGLVSQVYYCKELLDIGPTIVAAKAKERITK